VRNKSTGMKNYEYFWGKKGWHSSLKKNYRGKGNINDDPDA